MFAGERAPARFNLARYCLEAAARRLADKTALTVTGGPAERRFSFGEIEERVLRLANALDPQPQSRIVIRLPSGADYAFAVLAVIAAGAVAVPVSPLLTDSEVDYIVKDAGASAVIRDLTGCASRKTARYADTAADDPALLVYTSGTSGKPKGVLHGQRMIWGRRPMFRGWHDIGEDDVVLHSGALNWTYAMGIAVYDAWSVGAASVIYTGGRDHSVWPDLVRHHDVTVFASVPGLYRQVLKHNMSGFRGLRCALSAGEALGPALLMRWQAETGRPLYEAFGMSEISTYISSGPGVAPRPGYAGRPQPGRAVRLNASGSLEVHSSDPGLMLRYWAGDGPQGEWFDTGDHGTFDEHGYFHYLGRGDETMNAMGYRVSPLEVENVLLAHPSVLEAGVCEVRLSEDLSIITALVVPHGPAPDAQALIRFAGDSLASYKLPREVRFVTSLPRTANGKLRRQSLASLFQR